MDTDKLLVVGFGCEGKACKNALMEGGPYKVSAAMFPEYQGRLLIDAAIAAFNGAKLPAHIVAPSTARSPRTTWPSSTPRTATTTRRTLTPWPSCPSSNR